MKLKSGWRRTRLAVALICVVVLVLGTLVAITGHPFSTDDVRSAYARVVQHVGLANANANANANADTDGDGITDAVETEGWKTKGGAVFHTDPHKADTDGDGLPDGIEAGEIISGYQSTAVYSPVADPNKVDTDSDGIDDADEFFLDLNPRMVDTDRDGADDAAELACGSDPTRANPDGDSYTDQEECERDSDPLSYDLTHAQGVLALIEGAVFGDATGTAKHIGRLSEAQTESSEYLAGQIASSFLGVGAIRDLVADLGHGDLVSALLNATALIPLAGGAVATVVVITKFAKRGERGERAAVDVVERAPWSKVLKEKVLAKIFGTIARLPSELKGGSKTYSVYRSSSSSTEKYVGITNAPARRWSQHAKAGRAFAPEYIEGATRLTRNQARTIEESCIVRGGLGHVGGRLANKYHSINPAASYYAAALRYGDALLNKFGGTCPL